MSDEQFADLAVVMPAFNESQRIRTAVLRVLDLDFVEELIVVDDGSTDGTLDQLSKIADPRLRLESLPQNTGKGAALRHGFKLARSKYVAVHDADLEYDPQDFLRLLRPLREGRADVVYGSRFIGGEEHRVLYFWHSMGNKALTLISNMFTNLNLTDMETGAKVFSLHVIKSLSLREERFGFEPEVTARVAHGGFRVYEIGVSYAGRTYQQGKKIGWRDGFRALYVIGRYGIRRNLKAQG